MLCSMLLLSPLLPGREAAFGLQSFKMSPPRETLDSRDLSIRIFQHNSNEKQRDVGKRDVQTAEGRKRNRLYRLDRLDRRGVAQGDLRGRERALCGGDALCASLSEETSLLAVAKADCSVHVLRLKLHVSGANADWTHGETTTLSGHQGAVYLGSFSTDGSQLLTCSTALDMRMWNVQSGSCLAFCRQTPSFIRGIAFISYASSYATVEDIGYASIWRADGEKIVCTKRVFQEQELTVCIFHPKMKYVVSGSASSKIRIWDPARDRYTTDIIDFNSKSITALAFTTCGSYMVAGVAEGQIILRNMNSKLVVCIFRQHTAAITSMAFDRDNCRLAVGSRDAKMSVWDFGAPAMESRASDCGRVLQVRFVSDSHLVGICVNEPQFVGPQEEESIPLPLEAPTGSSGPGDF